MDGRVGVCWARGVVAQQGWRSCWWLSGGVQELLTRLASTVKTSLPKHYQTFTLQKAVEIQTASEGSSKGSMGNELDVLTL